MFCPAFYIPLKVKLELLQGLFDLPRSHARFRSKGVGFQYLRTISPAAVADRYLIRVSTFSYTCHDLSSFHPDRAGVEWMEVLVFDK